MTSTWEALEKRLNAVKPPVSVFKLCTLTDVRDRYLTAKREAEQADRQQALLSKDADPDARAVVEEQAKKAKAELEDAQKAYDRNTIVLRFQGLERQQLEELLAKHPPSEHDEANGSEFAEDSFMPALIAAASLDGMPEEAAARYMRTWTPADARALWNAAWSVQHTQRTDLGKG
ncbi:hypothetical protein ACIP2X_37845 [Streptomyces sp. NPDC089424]|uniref:hypothetical protein n=1 Tax=Streptomyces sp. NPDC089424 TaxID=3365917 RepID=UPI00381711DF